MLRRTKRKGRGKALKTVLLESEQAENSNTVRTAKPPHSSSDDDTPRRTKKEDSAGYYECARMYLRIA